MDWQRRVSEPPGSGFKLALTGIRQNRDRDALGPVPGCLSVWWRNLRVAGSLTAMASPFFTPVQRHSRFEAGLEAAPSEGRTLHAALPLFEHHFADLFV
jgi:hypothetical protein